MKVLILNAGSSTYKLAIYEIINTPPLDPQKPLWEGTIDWNANSNHTKILKHLLDIAIEKKAIQSLSEIALVGHRVVHGGSEFQQPTWITESVKQTIKNLFPLAPLHNPYNLKGIELCEILIPSAGQIAVFDTAFHATIPEEASTYAGPYSWKESSIKRYGFHGISHQYCSERCATLLGCDLKTLKLVSCHLGNGASLAAIDKGICIDTTMGFTPMDGLMMGSRSGSIDPGILLYLEQEKKQSAESLFHTLNYDSGLRGISGKSNDMRDIMQWCSEGDKRAILAYKMYMHSIKRYLGAMIAVLGKINVLIFTAGIGENMPLLRKEACLALEQLGVFIDDHKNLENKMDTLISSSSSKVSVFVIKTQEDWCIAKACWQLSFLRTCS